MPNLSQVNTTFLSGSLFALKYIAPSNMGFLSDCEIKVLQIEYIAPSNTGFLSDCKIKVLEMS